MRTFLMAYRFSLWVLLMASTSWEVAYGQVDPTALDHFRDGEQAILSGDTRRAIRYFRQALRISPDFSTARRSLGTSLMLDRSYDEAAQEFDQVIEVDSLFARALYYQSGLAHYNSARFELALQRFQKFDSLLQLPDYVFGIHGEKEKRLDSLYAEALPDRIAACRFSMASSSLAKAGNLTHLGKPINTPADEYFPFLSNNKQWMYFTRRKDPTEDEDLFVAQWKDGNWTKGRSLLGGINTNENEGMATFVRNGRLMIFTVCGRADMMGTCDLWQADFLQGEIVDFGPMPKGVNSETWDSQAALNCDGSVLYFSSYRTGGYGGADLWRIIRQPDGNWSEPQNLGPQINTPEDEEAPFITNDGKSLFFSSTGHPGLGESDIFVSWLSPDGEWTRPTNLGQPVNSPYQELGFFLSGDNKTAFISSDRPGGVGNMDIYRFDLPGSLLASPITFVQGKVYDAITLEPISTRIGIGEEQVLQSNENGHFFLCVQAGTVLDVRVWKRGYSVFQDFYPIPEHDNQTTFAVPVAMRPLGAGTENAADTLSTQDLVKDINLAFAPTHGIEFTHKVYFDFNSSELSVKEQEQLVQFMEGLPAGKIRRLDIYGYTDAKGSSTYNLQLSKERAEHVGDFMRALDLEVSYTKTRGAGEYQEEVDEKEKRRVEVRIWVEEK